MTDDIHVMVHVDLTLPLGLANEIDRESRRSGRGWPEMLSAMLIESMEARELAEMDESARMIHAAGGLTAAADSVLQL